jgi:gamma-glutamyltranspeptidase
MNGHEPVFASERGRNASRMRLTYNWHTGSMQIVWRDLDTGKLHGVTDPRRLGVVLGY